MAMNIKTKWSGIENRRGTFCISRQIITSHPGAVAAAMGKTIVVRAESRFDIDAVEYLAYCLDFDLLNDHEEPPKYNAYYDADTGEISFRRWGVCANDDADD